MRSQLVSGSLWLTGAKLFTTAIGFLSTIVLARLLVPEDFGLIAIAAASLAVVTALTDLPATVALVQLENPTRTDYDTAWTIGMARGLLVMLTLAGISPLIAMAYGDERLVMVLLALSLSPLLLGGLNPYLIVFERRLHFSRVFILETVSKIGSVLVAISVAFYFENYWALVVGPLTAAVITLILSYAMAPYRPRPSLGSIRVLWSFSSWLTLVSIVNTINQRVDQFVVGSVLGQRTLGHFSVGSDIANLIHAPVMPIMRTLYAGFSQLRGDRAALLEAYRQSQRFLSSFAPPFGVGLALIAEPMVRLTLGEVWLPAAIVIEILAPVFALELIAGATYPLVMSQGNTRALFWRDLAVLLFRLPLMAAGIIWFGLLGLLVARAAASAFGLALNIQLAHKATGLTYRDLAAGIWRPLCGITTMTAAVVTIHTVLDAEATPLLFIFAAIPLGAVVYATTVLALWFLSGRDEGVEASAVALGRSLLKRSRIPESGDGPKAS